jgi:hypothetical protein
MKAIARRHIDRYLQLLFQVLLDAHEIERVESAVRIVVDKYV